MAHIGSYPWLQADHDDRPSSDTPYVEATDLQTPGPDHASHPSTAEASDTKKSTPAEKIVFLDGLRGLSAMFVVITHAEYFHPFRPGVPAVDFFFVLSAFLLTMIFERTARELLARQAPLRSWAVQLTIYFMRRFLRVYPLFALFVIYMAIAPRRQQEHYIFVPSFDTYKILDVLTFRPHSHYYILWSLPVEIEYYFLIPVFVVVFIKLGRFWPLLVVPAYALVFYAGLYLGKTRGDRQEGPIYPHLPTLLCGSLAAAVYGRITAWIATHRFVFSAWHTYALRTVQLSAVTLLVSDLFNGLVYDWFLTNPAPQTQEGVCFVSVNLTTIIVCEMLQPGPVSAVLEWAVFVYAGKVSFSMYMLHTFVVHSPTLLRQQPFYFNQVILMWTAVFLVSTISYHLVERPCQLLAVRIGKWLKAFDAPSPNSGSGVAPVAPVAPEAMKMLMKMA